MSTRIVSIGSDPEFGYLDNHDYQVPASRYHQCDGVVGLDGHSDIGELRPAPGSDPLEHVRHLGRAIMSVSVDHKMVAGCVAGNDPIGGHIHFAPNYREGMDIYMPSRECLNIAHALDRFLAIPVVCLSNCTHHEYRCTESSYGRLSGVEYGKYHGGFEYRSLPSWIVSRGIAKCILSAAWVVCQEVSNGRLGSGELPLDVKRLYYAADRQRLMPLIPDIHMAYRKMEHYPQYAPYIEGLFGLVHAWNNGRGILDWRENEDIRKRWVVAPGFSYTNRDDRVEDIVETLRWKGPGKVRIYGINEERHKGKVLAVHPYPRRFPTILPELLDLSGPKISHQRWETRCSDAYLWIGIGQGLRKDVKKCRRIIELILSVQDVDGKAGKRGGPRQ